MQILLHLHALMETKIPQCLLRSVHLPALRFSLSPARPRWIAPTYTCTYSDRTNFHPGEKSPKLPQGLLRQHHQVHTSLSAHKYMHMYTHTYISSTSSEGGGEEVSYQAVKSRYLQLLSALRDTRACATIPGTIHGTAGRVHGAIALAESELEMVLHEVCLLSGYRLAMDFCKVCS